MIPTGDDMTAQTSAHDPHPDSGFPPRRNFLIELLALVTGAIVTLVPVAAGAVFVLNPLLRRKSKSASGGDDAFRLIGSTSGLQPGGSPQLFQVIGMKKDAWTTYPATSLGAVYVRQETDGSLFCLNARCTHMGCMVKFRPEQDAYVCPCHSSSFDLEGHRNNEIPPRDMDQLEVQVRGKDEIWVRFQNYRGGSKDQEPV